MDEYLKFAQDLARQAGQIIKDNFDKNLIIEIKSDKTPVTEIDKKINKLVSDAIKQKYPKHGLMGEEEDYGTGEEELRWLCDPIDGTKPFILGAPLSTFILGLTKDGQVLLSVVYRPYEDKLYHAIRGQGAFCNSQPIHVNKTLLNDGGYVIISESAFQYAEALKATGAQTDPLPGAGYRSTILASGRCSGIVQTHADFHDVGPASLIVEEAGGKATDLAGQAIRFDGPLRNGIILSNSVAHQELLSIVKP